MIPLSDLRALNAAFAAEAARTDPEVAVQSATWPTAGRMVDHLGNVQAWVTEIVRTGHRADSKAFTRPEGRDRIEWLSDTGATLVETLESADPDRECWTLFDAAPVTSFWRRRMTSEAAKHLWDLRTAAEASPTIPAELGRENQAGVIDEFADVFVPAARRRGIEALPRGILFVADDIDRQWAVSEDWLMTGDESRHSGETDVMRAAVGDLALFVWERADPWDLPHRFRIESGDTALRAFARTPVHL